MPKIQWTNLRLLAPITIRSTREAQFTFGDLCQLKQRRETEPEGLRMAQDLSQREISQDFFFCGLSSSKE
jgi:hypothetical protein